MLSFITVIYSTQLKTLFYTHQDEKYVSKDHSYPLVGGLSPTVSFSLVQTKYIGLPFTGKWSLLWFEVYSVDFKSVWEKKIIPKEHVKQPNWLIKLLESVAAIRGNRFKMSRTTLMVDPFIFHFSYDELFQEHENETRPCTFFEHSTCVATIRNK